MGCDEESKECHLVCDPGYVTSGQSFVSCTRSGTWSEDPRGLECEEAVMLVTGGDGGLNQAEVYSSTNSCITSLPPLPDLRQKHTVDYVSGNVLLCGGVRAGSRRVGWSPQPQVFRGAEPHHGTVEGCRGPEGEQASTAASCYRGRSGGCYWWACGDCC